MKTARPTLAREPDPARAIEKFRRKLRRQAPHGLRRLARSSAAEEIREERRGHLVWRPHHD